MRETVRLGTVAGIRVGLNLSVLVIVAILVVGLAVGRFPLAYPGYGVAAYVGAAVVTAVLFFASLLAHELAHAIVARRHGVEVAGIVLWLFGGVAQLRGEARTAAADFRIAAVGPLTSLAAAAVFAALTAILAALGVPSLAVGTVGYLALANVLLAVFNLVPAAPLDGGRVLRAALWAWRHDRTAAAVTAARAGRVFGYVLVAAGIVQVLLGSLGGLWLALVGWFLVNAASAEEQQARLAERLAGIRVRDVMSADPVTAAAEEPVQRFVDDTVWTHRHSTYPLVDALGRLTGLVTLNRIRATPPDRRWALRLSDIACRPADVPTSHPQEALVDLLPRMAGCADGRAVVLDDHGRLVGLVSPSDISRIMQVRDLRAFDPYRGPRGDLPVTDGRR